MCGLKELNVTVEKQQNERMTEGGKYAQTQEKYINASNVHSQLDFQLSFWIELSIYIQCEKWSFPRARALTLTHSILLIHSISYRC